MKCINQAERHCGMADLETTESVASESSSGFYDESHFFDTDCESQTSAGSMCGA